MGKTKKNRHWIFAKDGSVRYVSNPLPVQRTQTGKIPDNVGHKLNLGGYTQEQRDTDKAKIEENRRLKGGLAGWKQQ